MHPSAAEVRYKRSVQVVLTDTESSIRLLESSSSGGANGQGQSINVSQRNTIGHGKKLRTMAVKILAFGVAVYADIGVETDRFATPIKMLRWVSLSVRRLLLEMHILTYQRLLIDSSSRINSFSPVVSHNLRAKPGSLIWNLSFTRTASPFFGFEGVVCIGNVLRYAT